MNNSVHPDPDGLRFMSSSNWHSPWQIMAQNLTFLVRWNLIFPIFSSYISPVSHDNFKAGHGQNSGISPFSFWLLWTLWSGTGVELVTISGTWLAWWFGTWLGTWLLYDLYIFIYGMSSFPLTKSYVSRWLKPPTSNKWLPSGDFTVRALENHHVYER